MTAPRIMAVVNVTPDSFSDGGQFNSSQGAVDHALRCIDAGAHMLDIGGESTRPGATGVDAEEERRRVIPVIEGIRRHNEAIPISIDTMKADVAEAAIRVGANVINDVSAGRHDARMLDAAASLGVPLILMHMQGQPRTMQDAPHYDDVVADVYHFLRERVHAARAAGVPSVLVDVGIGFGKTLDHNVALLRNLSRFNDLADGQVLGISRKRFLGALTGIDRAADRDEATMLAHAMLLPHNVAWIRVHDVARAALLSRLTLLRSE
ncbi:MAG: dihydropteroate synthase [Candidatus Kapabacteria bacterium]|nr:dihydropteroate synthase [Candidatus Kapabacteria bacterium]